MPPKVKQRVSSPSEQPQLTLAELLETDRVRCGHCKKLYDQPVLLPCLHTLCTPCVVDIILRTGSCDANGYREQHTGNSSDSQSVEQHIQTSPFQTASNDLTKPVVNSDLEGKQSQTDVQHQMVLHSIGDVTQIQFQCPLCHYDIKLTNYSEGRKSELCDQTETTHVFRLNNCDDILHEQKERLAYDKEVQLKVKRLVDATLTKNYFLQSLTHVHTRKRIESRECVYCRYEGRSVEASSYCLDCKDDMCKDCSSAHMKTKVTRSHCVAWDEGVHRGLFDYDIRSRSAVPCSKHPSQAVELFCCDCQQPVCQLCSTNDHFSHQKEELEITSTRLLSEIKHIQSAFFRRAPSLGAYAKFLKEHKDKMLTSIETAKRQINAQVSQLHDMINRQQEMIINQLDDALREEKRVIDEKISDAQNAESSLVEASQLLLDMCNIGRPDEIISLYGSAMTRYTQLVNSSPTYSLAKKLAPVYRPGPCTEKNVSLMVGLMDVQMIPVNKEADCRKLLSVSTLMPKVLQPPEVLYSFNATLPQDTKPAYPTGLVINKDMLAVVDRENAKVKMFDLTGTFLLEFGQGEGNAKLKKPFDAAFVPSGDLAVTDSEAGCVKTFDRTGRFIKNFQGELRHPKGIVLNDKREVIVVDGYLRHLAVYDPTTGDMIRKLCPMISDHDSDNGSDILIDPYYIAIDQADNFILTDMAAPHIKIMTSQAQLLTSSMTYGTGPQELLHPGGLCVDKFGQILVADTNNSRIHLGLPDGEMPELLVTAKDGITKPTCLAITGEGHLCVGQSGGEIRILKYL